MYTMMYSGYCSVQSARFTRFEFRAVCQTKQLKPVAFFVLRNMQKYFRTNVFGEQISIDDPVIYTVAEILLGAPHDGY